MAERHQPEAPHQGPGIADEGPEEDLDDDVPEVLPGAAERQQRRDRQDRDAEPPARGRPAHARLAKIPPGRTNMRTMKMTKAMT